jgi:ribosomal protein S18 acetylase RimI-like enzyme
VSTFHIRRLVTADADVYRALMLRAYATHLVEFTSTPAESKGHPISWWEKRIGDDADAHSSTCAFGAFDGTALVGAVALEFETREKTRHKATLIGMYVAERARGSGAGRQLVEAAKAAARAREVVNVVQLTVTDGNAAARALYDRCGFVAFGIEPRAVFAECQYRSKVHMWCNLLGGE